MATINNSEILKQFGAALVKEFQAIVPKVTGKTAASVRMEVDEEGNILTIFGDEVLGTLETGRGPTVATSGSGAVIDGIKAWISAKGLNLSPFAVAFNIHKFGNTLFRTINNKGPINLQVNPVGLKALLTEQRISSFSALLADDLTPKLSSEIITQFKAQ